MTELDRVPIEGEVVEQGPSWEDHVQAFLTLEEEITDRRWAQARVAASQVRVFGQSSMVEFAKSVGKSKTTIYNMVHVHELWGAEDSVRPENLSWTHFVDALAAPEPQRAIEEAADQGLTTRQFKAHIKELEEPENVEQIKQTRVCPTCNGVGEVPMD